MNMIIVVIGIFVLTETVVAQTQVPHDFQSGTPARAAEVNANFDTLEASIDQNINQIEALQAQVDGPPSVAPWVGIAIIHGVDGNSTRVGYEDHFDIRELAFGFQAPAVLQSGGQGGGDILLDDIRLTIDDQRAIPGLNFNAATGAQIQLVEIFLIGMGQQGMQSTDLELRLEEVWITSVNYRSPAVEGDPLLVDLTLAPARLEVTNIVGDTTMVDANDPMATKACMFKTYPLLFVHEVNANPASIGTPISSFGFGLNVDVPAGIPSPPRFDAVFVTTEHLIDETVCLIGHLASLSEISSLEIDTYQSPLDTQEFSKLTLNEVQVRDFWLRTGPFGGVQVSTGFVYGAINWMTDGAQKSYNLVERQ